MKTKFFQGDKVGVPAGEMSGEIISMDRIEDTLEDRA